MDDDFGTPGALAALFDLVTAINSAREAGVAGEPFTQAQDELVSLAEVLGFKLRDRSGAAVGGRGLADAGAFIEMLLQLRDEARASKDWRLADRIRDGLADSGVVLEDTPAGTEGTLRPAKTA